jgi:hypothetical protein
MMTIRRRLVQIHCRFAETMHTLFGYYRRVAFGYRVPDLQNAPTFEATPTMTLLHKRII